MSYQLYLESDRWKNKRQEVFIYKGTSCERCGTSNNINIHHGSYRKKGDEPIKHLFLLCYECHGEFHRKYKMGDSMLNKTLNFIHGKGWRKLKKYTELVSIYK